LIQIAPAPFATRPQCLEELQVKGAGYLISSVSVLLLAVSPLKTAKDDPLLLFCLAGGVILSIVGMALRYLSHRRDQQEKHKLGRKLEHTSRQVEEDPAHGQGSPRSPRPVSQ
jgi:hypothetical protein